MAAKRWNRAVLIAAVMITVAEKPMPSIQTSFIAMLVVETGPQAGMPSSSSAMATSPSRATAGRPEKNRSSLSRWNQSAEPRKKSGIHWNRKARLPSGVMGRVWPSRLMKPAAAM